MDAFEILVIVLSIILALCLITSFVALIFFVQLLRSLKRITEKAETIADKVESASELFRVSSLSSAAFKMVANAVDMFKKDHHKKGKKE